MDEISFTSGHDRCAAWHFNANGAAFAGARGVPCVVMAPGFAGTRDTSALVDYARGFAAAGLDVVLFDYRGFGGSDGSPRQLVSASRQRQDYRAALANARQLPGVDPERLVLWGVSYSGGHVVRVAAEDGRVAAVVALTPVIDGVAVLAQLARSVGTRQLVRAAAHGVRDAQRAMTRRTPHLVPMVGQPGSRAIFAMDGAEQSYTKVAGPTWRNEVCARTALEVAFNRPITFAPQVRCPLLVQAGTADRVAPLATARRAAARAGVRGELREYPIDHVDVYTEPVHQRLLDDQLDFLGRHLSATASSPSANYNTPSRRHS
jgi:pimeloyl-ACP methyl ester carboxylesterase